MSYFGGDGAANVCLAADFQAEGVDVNRFHGEIMPENTDERIIALARQLCDFVDSVQPGRAGDGYCELPVAVAHRGHVIVNNLRPLLDQCEKQGTA